MSEDLVRILELLEGPPVNGALATLVAIDGSSYRRPGARLLWLADGRRAGGISGGCLEADVIEHAQLVAETGVARHVAYNTDADGDPVWGVGTGCDGRLDIIIEPLAPVRESLIALPSRWESGQAVYARLAWRPGQGGSMQTQFLGGAASGNEDHHLFLERVDAPPELWIFGAGDDAQPLATMARAGGFRIHIFDTRPALLTAARFPGAVLEPWIAGDSPSLPTKRGRTAAVVMSHRFQDDVEALAKLANAPLAYLGILGARRRTGRLAAALEPRLGSDACNQLFATARAPVGLDLGGDGSGAIALSILSEIQAVLHDADATPLSHHERPIHSARSGRRLDLTQSLQGGGGVSIPR